MTLLLNTGLSIQQISVVIYFIKWVLSQLTITIIILLAYLLAWLGHINLFRVLNTQSWGKGIRPLKPGESYSWDSLPLSNQDYFINAQIGLVVERIVDENNLVDESNEDNNYRIYRWWFPYKTESPF